MNEEILREIPGYADYRKRIADREAESDGYRSQTQSVWETVARYHPSRLSLTLERVVEETPTTRTLRFTPRTGYLPPFQAGQYVNLFVEIGGVRTSRPYTISSGPRERRHYELTVKRVEEGFVSDYLLDHASAGQTYESTGPMGNFFYNPLYHGDDLVFLAGGSGITPAYSMIQDMADRRVNRRFHLVYGSRSEDDIIFEAPLQKLEAELPGLRVTHVLSEPSPAYDGRRGFITAELLRDLLGEIEGKMFYVCGPPAMYDFCVPELEKLGIPRRRIRLEAYGPPAAPHQLPGWPADVGLDSRFRVKLPDGREIQAPAGEPLLNTLERNGAFSEAACRSGECSLCRLKLVAGRVLQPEEARVRRSDRRHGFIHSCVSYPLSDLEIEY
jgi:ferredoxin-NADP reductase